MDNEFKGTKAPWHCVEYAGFHRVQNGEKFEDNDILDFDILPVEEVKANIKLIEAAPDLLNASMAISSIIASSVTSSTSDSMQRHIRDFNKAINKALGISDTDSIMEEKISKYQKWKRMFSINIKNK